MKTKPKDLPGMKPTSFYNANPLTVKETYEKWKFFDSMLSEGVNFTNVFKDGDNAIREFWLAIKLQAAPKGD